MKFAKLFELGKHQVLATVKYDNEKEVHIFSLETSLDGVIIGMDATYKEEYKALRSLGSYTEDMAKRFLENAIDVSKKTNTKVDET